MNDWTLRQLPWGGRLALTAIMCAIGVGFIFSTLQIRYHQGGLSYGNVVEEYYGEPAERAEIEARWQATREDLVTKWNAGLRGETPDSAGAQAPGPNDRILARARSLDHLLALINREERTDLEVRLHVPNVAELISLGHVHTFGHVAFLIPVSLFVLLTWLPWKWKGLLAALPHIGVIFDYPSAVLTRVVAPEFAALLMLAGFLMGGGFAVSYVVLMYELWFRRS